MTTATGTRRGIVIQAAKAVAVPVACGITLLAMLVIWVMAGGGAG
ncbi:MAG TPA: hypothetical protein VMA95_15660 [Streptosporangiaceae bacterium]|nr:hypothetical protein [Streptosporangiaceae bacterium]